jgi:hypothetical protein
VCAKAEELDAAALVIGSSGKGWVRAGACARAFRVPSIPPFLAIRAARLRRMHRRLARAHACARQVFTYERAPPPLPPKRGLVSTRAIPALQRRR